MLPHYVIRGNIPLNELLDKIQEFKANALDPVEYTNWADLEFSLNHYLDSYNGVEPDLTVIKNICLKYHLIILGPRYEKALLHNDGSNWYTIEGDVPPPKINTCCTEFVNYVSFNGVASTICKKCGKLKE